MDSKISGFTFYTLSDSLGICWVFFHFEERIHNYPNSLPNSRDACGRKPYPERKRCGLKNSIEIRVDGPLHSCGRILTFVWTDPYIRVDGPLHSCGRILTFVWTDPYIRVDEPLHSCGRILTFVWTDPYIRVDGSLHSCGRTLKM